MAPCIVVTFKFMICLPRVAPRENSMNQAYRKNKTPCRNAEVPMTAGTTPRTRAGIAAKARIIVVITQMIMLSIIPAINLRSQ